MLQRTDDLNACQIQSMEGDLGKIHDVYFDDEEWAIRYLVVATNNWFIKREALISPISLIKPDWLNKTLKVNLTQEQIDDCPDISVHEPVSRQQEYRYFGYYGYPIYWGGVGLWGQGFYPDGLMTVDEDISDKPNALAAKAYAETQNEDPHLRSWKEVKGYVVNGSDGEIGHIHDLLIDEKTYAVRYVVVRTNHWWTGHDILLPPQWFTDIKWKDSSAFVNHTRDEIKGAPNFEALATMDRDWEVTMHKHYKRKGYWTDEAESLSA
ncbi:PRC-barrel domain-containing protein [Psychrosphaera algicola]|uniref:PRC-barrel domain-containing protein n=1 Tax=Psychrosphaera algicola TaxID=3023714 RepID=A0ABT5F988_9GAMM|nr:PRC-barrel domain-containing protein [Psychrosphaera sp. G1-22]MDC2887981.1 PRC-barrel domain-containing protein [Psychrosphaera sp. G1-22]